jgi:hypothetical protein
LKDSQKSKLEKFAEENKDNPKLKELKTTIDRLYRKIDDMKSKNQEYEDTVYKAVRDSMSDFDMPPVKKPVVDKRTKGEEVTVAMLADWQLGKVTPSYNSDVARERIDLYGDKVIQLTNIRRNAMPIKKCHVWILGDIVEGEDIFPGNQWLIDSSLYRQVTKNGLEILGDFIRKMLANFDEVHVTAVIGNHGRIGRYGQHHPETNMDRMLYTMVETMLSNEERLTWNIPEYHEGDRGWYAIDTIGKYSCMLVHGDQFRGTLGIPFYGVRKKVLGWKSMAANPDIEMDDFKDVAFGHWHQVFQQDINGIGVRCSGSPESYNTFAAENLAAMGRPSQRMMFVSPDRGHVTAEVAAVWLDIKEDYKKKKKG